MISYLLKLKKESHLTKENIINDLLFVVLTLLSAAFTIGMFTSTSSTEPGNQEGFYSIVKYYPGKVPQPYITIPLIVIYLGLTVFLLYRLKNKLKENKFVICIFLFFIFFRLISTISFPYGKQDYTYISFIDNQNLNVSYSGFTMYERVITFLYDFCFYSYFVVFFHIYNALVKDNRFFFNILFIGFQLFVVFMIVYSFVTEWEEYINNLKAMFVDFDLHFSFSITSFVTNKNTFGFFLMVGVIFAIFDFLYHENVFSLALIVFFTLVDFCVLSRTTLVLICVMNLCLVLLYPLFNFKKKRKWSIFFLSIITIFIIVLLLFVTVFKESFYDKYILKFIDNLTSMGTVSSRKDLTSAGMTMMNNPYYIFFGYSKTPFITIFAQYNDLLPIDHHVKFTLHNVYADIYIQYGLVGCVSFVIILGKIIYNLLTKIIYKHEFDNIYYLILLSVILIYIYFEPRFIIAENAACAIFVLILMIPYSKRKEKERPTFLEAV